MGEGGPLKESIGHVSSFDLGYHSYQAEEKAELNGLDYKTLQKHLINQTTHQWLIQHTPHHEMLTEPMEPSRQKFNMDNT